MKIAIVIPTKSIRDPLLSEGNVYLKKLRPPIFAQSLFLNPKSNIEEARKDLRMSLEGTELLKKTEGYTRIALTEEGKTYTSKSLATFLEGLSGRKLAFIIGGAFGLSPYVKSQCQFTLSLSPLTLPHRLSFMILCEQIYRAQEILRNSPYHK